ncbi:uncharacterized protein LOC135496859 [Lineus longissimus]|uniref:uncharacterized protein LOC135496859 n=1 Tax=Lineus longissimus TaxID=88925 RepID=UPI002B4EAA5E
MDGMDSKDNEKSTVNKLMSAGFTIDDEQLKKFRSEITGLKENNEMSLETQNISVAKPSNSLLYQERCDSPSLDPKWQSFLSDVFNRPDNEQLTRKRKSSPTPPTSPDPKKKLTRVQKRRLRKKNSRLERLKNAKDKLDRCSGVSDGARRETSACPSAGPSNRVSQKDCADSRNNSLQNTTGKYLHADRCVSGTNGLSGHLKSGTSEYSTELVATPSCSSGSNQKHGVKRPSSSIGCTTDQSGGVQSKNNCGCDFGSGDDGTHDVDKGAKTLHKSDGKRMKLDSVLGSADDTSGIFVSESEEEEVLVIYDSGLTRSEIVEIVQEKFGQDIQIETGSDSEKGTDRTGIKILDKMHDRVPESSENVSDDSDCKVLTSNGMAKPVSSVSDSELVCDLIISSKGVIKKAATPGKKSTSVSPDRTPCTSAVSSSVPSSSGVWASKENYTEASSSKCTKVSYESSQSIQGGKTENPLGEKPSTSGKSSSQDNECSSTRQTIVQSCRGLKRTIEELESKRPRPEQYVALDCEFVGVGEKGRKSALGRASIVNYYGKVVLDIYSCPEEPITDFRTPWSGIHPYHMKNAVPFESARRRIKQIIEGKIIIGHAIHNDLEVLKIAPSQENIRDTITSAKLKEMMGSNETKCSLKKMARALLDRWIQKGSHCSVEDARASLDLFKLIEQDWDGQLKQTKRRKRGTSETESYLDDAYWLFD